MNPITTSRTRARGQKAECRRRGEAEKQESESETGLVTSGGSVFGAGQMWDGRQEIALWEIMTERKLFGEETEESSERSGWYW